jgi:hypothetical protein
MYKTFHSLISHILYNRCMRFPCQITKATIDPHTRFAFTMQQWVSKHASLLHYSVLSVLLNKDIHRQLVQAALFVKNVPVGLSFSPSNSLHLVSIIPLLPRNINLQLTASLNKTPTDSIEQSIEQCQHPGEGTHCCSSVYCCTYLMCICCTVWASLFF